MEDFDLASRFTAMLTLGGCPHAVVSLHFGPDDGGLVTLLVYPPDSMILAWAVLHPWLLHAGTSHFAKPLSVRRPGPGAVIRHQYR